MGLQCLHTSIFMETPSPEGLPTKAKENPSPHEMRLSPAGHQPSISWSLGDYYYYYYYYHYYHHYYCCFYYFSLPSLLYLWILFSPFVYTASIFSLCPQNTLTDYVILSYKWWLNSVWFMWQVDSYKLCEC